MVEQVRNDDHIALQRGDYFARNEPNAAWSHTVSNHMMIPGLHCFWPMSGNHHTHQAVFLEDLASDYDLNMEGTPYQQVFPGTLIPCVAFTAGLNSYLEHADDAQFDIIGTEPDILPAQRGLMLGGWWRWTDRTAQQGLMSKWRTVGNQRSYRIIKNAAHQIVFEVSTDGAATVSITSVATVSNDIWYWIGARFVPSTALDVYVNTTRTTLAAGVPATLYHGTAPFAIGRSNVTDYFLGYTSLCWLSGSMVWDGTAATRDLYPWVLIEHSKRLFNL